MDSILDEAPHRYSTVDCSDTDLVKVVMNRYGIRRRLLDRMATPQATRDEFSEYVEKWGIPKTSLHSQGVEFTRIVKADDRTVGLVVRNQLFVLPFSSVRRSEAADIAVAASRAVIDYLARATVLMPAWLDDVRFEGEENLTKELGRVQQELARIEEKKEAYNKYKAILVARSDALRDAIVFALQDFFELDVDDADQGVEDLTVRGGGASAPNVLVEVKGTKGGLKRDHVDQVSSHRDRRGIASTTVGVLILNDFLDEADIEARRNKPVDSQHIKSAVKKHVVILRTADLLEIMRVRESAKDRSAVWNEIIACGGGLIQIEADGSIGVRAG